MSTLFELLAGLALVTYIWEKIYVYLMIRQKQAETLRLTAALEKEVLKAVATTSGQLH